ITFTKSSNRKNQTRDGFSSPTREFAFPHGGAMRRPDLRRAPGDDATDPRNRERGVRVLPHLSDYPMRHGDDGERREFKRRRDAGERAHQKLVRRRAVEPVVEGPVNGVDVARSQGVIQLQNHVSVLGLRIRQSIQFLKEFSGLKNWIN
ncbi:hypothetical protein HID58_068541, partial [Brassica napus]